MKADDVLQVETYEVGDSAGQDVTLTFVFTVEGDGDFTCEGESETSTSLADINWDPDFRDKVEDAIRDDSENNDTYRGFQYSDLAGLECGYDIDQAYEFLITSDYGTTISHYGIALYDDDADAWVHVQGFTYGTDSIYYDDVNIKSNVESQLSCINEIG